MHHVLDNLSGPMTASIFTKAVRDSLEGDLPDWLLQEVPKATHVEVTVQFAAAQAALRACEAAKAERGRVSRQIGNARKQGLDTGALIKRVAALTLEMKQANATVNDQISSLFSLTGNGDTAEETQENQHSLASLHHRRLSNGWADSMEGRDQPNDRPNYFHPDQPRNGKFDKLVIDDRVSNDEWNSYVDQHPRATSYHDARWRHLLNETFGHEIHYLAARDTSKQIVGLIPAVQLQSRMFGNFMVSMPFLNYGGPLVDCDDVRDALLQAVSNRARDLECSHVEIRETQMIKEEGDQWPVKTNKVAMVLPLPNSTDELDRILKSSVRSQSRRALKAGASVECGGLPLFDEFYTVFSRNMRDLGTPVYSKAFFRNILDTFSDRAFLMVVRVESKPVAAAFLIGHRDTLEIPWASSLREANQLSVNMMLYRQVLDEAIRRQYRFFDFGRSSKDAPTYRFKKQWGAVEYPLFWRYWLSTGGQLPSLSPENNKFRLAILAWQQAPLWVTNTLGPGLVKYLP